MNCWSDKMLDDRKFMKEVFLTTCANARVGSTALAALHLVSADIWLGLAARTLIVPMCTGDFWVNINNSELFVEQKWSYLNVEGDTLRQLCIYLARGKIGEMCHHDKSQNVLS